MTVSLMFICEPSDYVSVDNDITLMYQAASRDPRVALFHLPTSAVNGDTTIHPARISAPISHDDFIKLNESAREECHIVDIDIVFCRTRKPFPPDYLDHLCAWTRHTTFLNSPASKKIQTAPSFLKSVADRFTPPMCVTNDVETARQFLHRHTAIVAKRAGSSGGLGVYKLTKDGTTYVTDHIIDARQRFEDFESAFSFIAHGQQDGIELVRFLPNAVHGDKRVVVINGEIYGAYLRRSTSGHWVQNRTTGDSVCTLATISKAESEAIENTVPYYSQLDLNTLGYDFLCDDDGVWKISEINAGNIGGVSRLEHLTGKPCRKRFLTWMLDRHASSRN